MPFPLILAAATPVAISTIQAWLIGTSVVVGTPTVVGGGWMLYRWFKPPKKTEMNDNNTPLDKMYKESLQLKQTLSETWTAQISLVERSTQEVVAVRQSGEKLSSIAVSMASYQDEIARKSLPLKAEISKLLQLIQKDEHLIKGLSEKLKHYITLKQGGKLSSEQELRLLKNILAYRDEHTPEKENRLRPN
jgi:hypothetical protein